MSTLSVTLTACAIQITLVALAAIIVRVCLPGALSASRAAVGSATAGTFVLLTLVVFVPLPRSWTWLSLFAEPAGQLSGEGVRDKPNLAERSNVGESEVRPSVEDSSSGGRNANPANVAVAPDLLRYLQSAFRAVTPSARAKEAPATRILLWLLLAGSGLGLMRLAIALFGVQRLRATGKMVADRDVVDRVADLAKQCGTRAIELRETDRLGCAATFGWLRPVILLPACWLDWSADELNAVLAHEVAHVKRADFWFRLLGRLSVALHFYHPLVRAGARWLAMDQEAATDRLAIVLCGDRSGYVRGLAHAALRLDGNYGSKRVWSGGSIIPMSSDFLSRRIEMLRSNEVTRQVRHGSLVTICAVAGVVAVAVSASLLRGPVATAEEPTAGVASTKSAESVTKPASGADPAARTARRTVMTFDGKAMREADAAVLSIYDAEFRREPFYPSCIPDAEHGAILIRVGEILRHPEVQPYVELINSEFAEIFISYAMEREKFPDLDLRQVDWVAANVIAEFRVTKEVKVGGSGEGGRLVVGANGFVIHMAKSRSWRDLIAQQFPKAQVVTEGGTKCIEFPPIPAMGPGKPRLRFPDDRTIVVTLAGSSSLDESSTKQDDQTAEAKEVAARDANKPYRWEATWRAVDGGLVTFVCDNDSLGRKITPNDKEKMVVQLKPLYENVDFYGVGLDWNAKTNRFSIQSVAACQSETAADEVLGAMCALSTTMDTVRESAAADVTLEKTPQELAWLDLWRNLLQSVVFERTPPDGKNQLLHVRTSFEANARDVKLLLGAP